MYPIFHQKKKRKEKKNPICVKFVLQPEGRWETNLALFLLSEKVPFPGMERRQASPLSAAVTQGWLCAPRTHSTLQQQQPAQHLG